MKRIRPKLGLREIGGRFALSFGLIAVSAISFRYHHKNLQAAKTPAGHILVPKPVSLNSNGPSQPRSGGAQTGFNPEKTATARAPDAIDDSGKVAKPPHSRVLGAVRKHVYFYKDGDFVGTPIDIFYGLVQVSVTIRDGWITDVKWLADPEDIDLSQQINRDAMPKLTKEAIKVQNAQVDAVSGASFTVLGFRASLASALAQAAPDHNTP